MKLSQVCAAGVCFLWAGVAADAQEQLFDLAGTSPFEHFGFRIANVGDTNGDGIDDLWVNREAITQVFSGSSGELLIEVNAIAGPLSAVGDLDHDGYADLLWGNAFAFYTGSTKGGAFVASGRTGQVLLSCFGDTMGAQFGFDVDQAGDVNGDGWPDIVVGAPQTSGFGSVLFGTVNVVSGLDGSRLWTFPPLDAHIDPRTPLEPSSNYFGTYVAGLGDQDLDGFCDVGGAPWISPWRAYVYSGVTGETLATVTPSSGPETFSLQFTDVGDVTGDGIPEMAIGDYDVEGGVYFSALDIVRGGSFDLHLRLVGDSPDLIFGFAADGGEDLNGDGLADLLVTASDCGLGQCTLPPVASTVQGFSGLDGTLLFTFAQDPVPELIHYGDNCALLGDTNGDGCSEFVVGAYAADLYGHNEGGLVRWYSSCDLSLSTNKLKLPLAQGGTQSLRLQTDPALAGDLYLVLGTLSGIVPGLELNGWHLPLNPDGYTSIGLIPGASPLKSFAGVVDPAGKATASLKLPAGLPPELAGLDLQHCCLVLDPVTGQIELVTNSVPLYLE